MRNHFLIFFLAIVLGTSAIAASPVKKCSTVLKNPETGASLPTVFEIFRNQMSLSAKITQTVDGQARTYSDVAVFMRLPVRAGLSAQDLENDRLKLNMAEKLVVHAMMMTEDPIFEGDFSTGLDLNVVRSANVFMIGEISNMGLTAIVEARDGVGRPLGSFLGGLFVRPCDSHFTKSP